MTLAIFGLQVTPMLPTKSQANWHVCSGQEAKHMSSRWSPQHLLNILAIFIYKSPRCFLPSFKSIGLSIQE